MEKEIGTKSGRLLSQAREFLPSTAAVTGKSRRDCFQTQAGEMDWHKVAIWSPHIRPLSFQGEEAWKKVKLQALTPVTRVPLAFPFMVPSASWGGVAVVGRALLLNGNQFSSKVIKDLWQQPEYTPASPAHTGFVIMAPSLKREFNTAIGSFRTPLVHASNICMYFCLMQHN